MQCWTRSASCTWYHDLPFNRQLVQFIKKLNLETIKISIVGLCGLLGVPCVTGVVELIGIVWAGASCLKDWVLPVETWWLRRWNVGGWNVGANQIKENKWLNINIFQAYIRKNSAWRRKEYDCRPGNVEAESSRVNWKFGKDRQRINNPS